jgi:integrase
VLLLILTGQRKGEIAALEWSWIDEAKWTITIPASVAKNRCQHTFPYGQGVADIFAEIPREKPALFSVYNWDARTDQLRERAAIPHFVLHDLRRTYASGMAALGVPPHVVEKLLNHLTGTVSGIAAVYNRYRYADEMAEAVTKWETHLRSLTRPA